MMSINTQDMQIFRGKTVIITGASSGFGEACAKLFAQHGARLITIARRKDRLLQLEQLLHSQYKSQVLSLALDVADMESVAQHLNDLPADFANVDILINNAGLVRGLNSVWETAISARNEMIDINIKGVLNLCAQVIPGMIARNSGHIINVGSVSGHDTYSGGGVYCATKFAVTAITDTLRKELVATPLRVSMISPGMADTNFSLTRFSGDEAKAKAVYQGFQPLTANDVAEIIVFMASRPPHVNIADVIVYPTHQASVSLVHRQ